jgi:release factor glutamine methyltransferase
VAQRNAATHGVAERIQFREGNLFGPLEAGEQFDFVISNPPYIPTGDIPTLEVGVAGFEPKLALDGGADGFEVFDRILAGAKEVLAPGGSLILEIGAPQHEKARRKFGEFAEYELAETIYDGSRHPRVLRAKRA